LVWSCPAGDWRVTLAAPVVQVTIDGLILCAPAGFGSDGTSIPEWLPIRREGEWSTGSLVHDAGYCLGHGFRLLAWGGLDCVRVTRAQVDESWRQAHYVKRYTQPCADRVTAAHYAGIRAAGWARWRRYRADSANEHHEAVGRLLTAAERAVWRLLTEGVASVEGPDGYALAWRGG
jgi:hypothetical protein